MSAADRRALERAAGSGDYQAQAQLERARCRVGEHCGCRLSIQDLCDERWISIGGVYERDWSARAGEVTARVSLKIVGDNAALVLERLGRLVDKLGLPALPPLNVEDRECSYCGAKPGDPCMTKSGKRAKDRHAGRLNPPGVAVVHDHGAYGYYPYEDDLY